MAVTETGRMLRFARNCLRDQADNAESMLFLAQINHQHGQARLIEAVLRDIEMKSRLLLHHQEHEGRCVVCCTQDDQGWHEFPCATVREIVGTFSGHPDFQQEWAA